MPLMCAALAHKEHKVGALAVICAVLALMCAALALMCAALALMCAALAQMVRDWSAQGLSLIHI